ncbi:uncharacterized protein SCODWIG_00500 [Saccharomycodes ludwigii]|uniref:Thioesterase domain-containing protein n=2 Tax=Saccharomycodes ludwigii TaxID=36035 RepID=A0A376B298_9ASCO|nr:uncharacterized protein SCODWIG_00500 [Saccharomycodes ludwigii]
MPNFGFFFSNFVLLPTLGFTTGVITFIKPWPTLSKDEINKIKSNTFTNEDVLSRLQKETLPEIIESSKKENSTTTVVSQGQLLPLPHHKYHIGKALLSRKGQIEIDPIITRNSEEVNAIFHFGSGLINEKGYIHKGIVALAMDEVLCYCGFPHLPSKKGVTAKLDLEYLQDIPSDTTVLLNCKVKEVKGRKCVITGELISLPNSYNGNSHWYDNIFFGNNRNNKKDSTVYATGKCILVEPKWFKYLKWIDIFG